MAKTHLAKNLAEVKAHVLACGSLPEAFEKMKNVNVSEPLKNWFTQRYGWEGSRKRTAYEAFTYFYNDVKNGIA